MKTAAKSLLSILPLLALAACSGGDDPEPTPSDEATEAAEEEPVSIMRPDIEEAPVLEPADEPLEVTIGFPAGGEALDAGARKLLEQVVAAPQIADKAWPIVLRGHTDSEGYDGDNIVMSRRRADAVAAYLADNGVAEDRIRIVAIGEGRPLEPNTRLDGSPNEAGKQANRRVEIVVAPTERESEDAETEADSDDA